MAPIKRSSNPEARAVSANAYIVTFKNTSTITSASRADWLNGVMSTAGVAMAKAESDTLRMKWSESVLNGIAGTFSDSVLDVIRSQDDVDFVEPGMSIFYFSFCSLSAWHVNL
jgi:cerevisin